MDMSIVNLFIDFLNYLRGKNIKVHEFHHGSKDKFAYVKVYGPKKTLIKMFGKKRIIMLPKTHKNNYDKINEFVNNNPEKVIINADKKFTEIIFKHEFIPVIADTLANLDELLLI